MVVVHRAVEAREGEIKHDTWQQMACRHLKHRMGSFGYARDSIHDVNHSVIFRVYSRVVCEEENFDR